MSIQQLGLTSRIVNALASHGVLTVEQLLGLGINNLSSVKGIGLKGVYLIYSQCTNLGISVPIPAW